MSGNPAGKPIGTRHAFSQGFIRDFALVWQEEGLEAVRKVARKSAVWGIPFVKRDGWPKRSPVGSLTPRLLRFCNIILDCCIYERM